MTVELSRRGVHAWDEAQRDYHRTNGRVSLRMPILDDVLSAGWVSVELEHPEALEARARLNHGQTLVRLVQRGGLGFSELEAILRDESYQATRARGGDELDARAYVLHHPAVLAVGCGGCQAWGIKPPIERGRCRDCRRTAEEIRAAEAVDTARRRGVGSISS